MSGVHLLQSRSLAHSDPAAAEKTTVELAELYRGVLINMDKVESLDREGDRKYFAIMGEKERLRLPISRERLAEVKKSLGIILLFPNIWIGPSSASTIRRIFQIGSSQRLAT